MFWQKNKTSDPLGVPLSELREMLKLMSIKVTTRKNTLIAEQTNCKTTLEVVPAEEPDSANGLVRAVVRITTLLPKPCDIFKETPEIALALNQYAALSALVVDDVQVRTESRLTVYAADDAWETLHFPLLLSTIMCGAEASRGGMRAELEAELEDEIEEEDQLDSATEWTEQAFKQVERHLSPLCACTTGGLGFTAEFGLEKGAYSQIMGHKNTALFQQMADQPHPSLGGGLLCTLQMPHRIESEQDLIEICALLNQSEMQEDDLPPHFGAWCEGRLDGNPTYVSFYPNMLYTVSGLAVNAAYWAMHRAQWANKYLASRDIRV